MRQIRRYELEAKDEQTIIMAPDARVLSAAFWKGKICIWADVNADNYLYMPRSFMVRGTGHEPPESARFIDTVLIPSHDAVFHVYEATGK